MMSVKGALMSIKKRFGRFRKRLETNFREATSQAALGLFAFILLLFSVYFGWEFNKSSLSVSSLVDIVSVYVAILVPFLLLVQIADKLVEEIGEVRTLARASVIAISSLVTISFLGVPYARLLLFASVSSLLEFLLNLLTLALVFFFLIYPYGYNVSRIIGLILKYLSKDILKYESEESKEE
jgi:glucan phosphoethanolaminetransferase (alkaline phosphatase superfamily)